MYNSIVPEVAKLNGAWNLENELKQCIHVLHELAYYIQSLNDIY